MGPNGGGRLHSDCAAPFLLDHVGVGLCLCGLVGLRCCATGPTIATPPAIARTVPSGARRLRAFSTMSLRRRAPCLHTPVFRRLPCRSHCISASGTLARSTDLLAELGKTDRGEVPRVQSAACAEDVRGSVRRKEEAAELPLDCKDPWSSANLHATKRAPRSG